MASLKFPELKGVEYIDIIKNRKNVLLLKGEEVESFKWRDLQLHLGKVLSPGSYHYAMKFKKENKVHNGTIKAVATERAEISTIDPNLLVLSNKLQTLEKDISTIRGGAPANVDYLMRITETAYKFKIDVIERELTDKKAEISQHKAMIEKLKSDIDRYEEEIDEAKNGASLSNILKIINDFKGMLGGKPGTPLAQDQKFDTSGIPEEILRIIGSVDFTRIPPDQFQQIVNMLETFIQQLPLLEKDPHV